MLLAEKTKQQKLIENKAKKSNAFGLGLTSLIAACSSAVDNKGDDKDRKIGSVGTIPTANLKAEELLSETADVGYYGEMTADIITATIGTADDTNHARSAADAEVTVKAGKFGVDTADLVLQFANGQHKGTKENIKPVVNKLGSDKFNLVVSSDSFGPATPGGTPITGAVYIFWDIASITPPADPILVADTVALNHLKIAGTETNIVSNTGLKFYKNLGGDQDQVDMVFRSLVDGAHNVAQNTLPVDNINILWDVTKYYDATATEETKLTLDSSPGILQIKLVAAAETEVDIETYEFRKINNNNDYDILIKGKVLDISSRSSGYNLKDTYILWDAASYYDATKNVSIELTAASATNGLLKITGLIENIMTSGLAEDGYTDINKGGINDLAFKYGDNIFILFGEKIAIRDDEGKAFSYEVDLATINTTNTFYKDDTEVTADSDAEKEGFFSYDFDGDGGNEAVEKVGYRFAAGKTIDLETALSEIEGEYTAANPPPAPAPEDELSSAAYWDIA